MGRLAIAIAIAAPLSAFVVAPADAAGGVTCKTQSGTATITPGFSTTPKVQKIAATVKLSGCTGGVTGGTDKATVTTIKATCTSLATIGTKNGYAGTITWNTKKTSTFKGTATTGPKVGQATIAATISAGLLKGKKMSTVVSFAPAAGGGGCTNASPLKKLTVKGVKPFVIK